MEVPVHYVLGSFEPERTSSLSHEESLKAGNHLSNATASEAE